MPKLYQRTAQNDIYRDGKRTKSNNKQGYTLDRHIPGSKTDIIIVKKGERYYTWHPKGSAWQYSINKPDLRDAWTKESEEWQNRADKIKDRINDVDEFDEGSDLDCDLSDFKEELEGRIDELQYNLDSMPDQLQDSSVLNERIEELQNILDDIDE